MNSFSTIGHIFGAISAILGIIGLVGIISLFFWRSKAEEYRNRGRNWLIYWVLIIIIGLPFYYYRLCIVYPQLIDQSVAELAGLLFLPTIGIFVFSSRISKLRKLLPKKTELIADDALPSSELQKNGISEITNKCPKCAEEIKIEALVCRFCQHEFDKTDVQQTIKQIEARKEEERKLLDEERKRNEASLLFKEDIRKKKNDRNKIAFINERSRFFSIAFFTFGVVFTLMLLLSLFNVNDNKEWSGVIVLAFISGILHSVGFIILRKRKKRKEDLAKIDAEIKELESKSNLEKAAGSGLHS